MFYATAVAGGILAKAHGNFVALSLLFVLLVGVLVFTAYSKRNWLFHPLAFYATGLLFYILCFLLGFTAVSFVDWKNKQHQYVNAVVDQQWHQVDFRILEKQKTKGGKQQYIVEIEGVDTSDTRGQALVVAIDQPGQLGQKFTGIGYFQSFPKAINPGQFDYQLYMQHKQIYKQLKIRRSVSVGVELSLSIWMLEGRALLQKQLNKNEKLSNQSKALLGALLLGNRKEMDEELTASFQRLGLLHLLAISGLHIGLLAVFATKLLFFVKPRYRRIILLCFLWSFAFMTGFSPSVFRTVLMFSSIVLAQSVLRQQPTSESIGLSLFLTLLFNPYWLFDVGFQFSYLAVLGIVWLMPLFKKGYTSSRIGNYFLRLCYVSLVAQICVLPLQLYYFHAFSATFLGSNLLIIPLITLLVLGGFILVSVGWVSEFIAGFLGMILEQITQGIVLILQGLNQVNFAFSKGYITKETMVVLLVICATIGIVLHRPRLKRVIFFLSFLVVVAVSWVYFASQNKNREEFCIAAVHGQQPPLYWHYTRQQLYVFGQEESTTKLVEGYKKKYAYKEEMNQPSMTSYTVDANRKLLVIAREQPYYALQTHFQLIYFINEVKLNVDRLLDVHQPKMVIIGFAMGRWYKQKLIQSCMKKNIPFHDMREKGYWSSQFL